MNTTEPLRVIQPDGAVNGYDPRLSEAELLHCYRAMLQVRAFAAICLKLQRSGPIGFSIPNEGIEATQVGAASALRKTDWIFPSGLRNRRSYVIPTVYSDHYVVMADYVF